MKRLLPVALVALLGFGTGTAINAAHAGEDPVVCTLSKSGIGAMGGCDVVSGGRYAFQCMDGALTGCKVRYRMLTAAEALAGYPIPTDGGPMIDAGTWGPLVDFSASLEPYRVMARTNQTRIYFYAEDAGSSGGHVGKLDVFGLFP